MKGGGVGGGGRYNDDFNVEYHRFRPPYSSSSRIEANAEDYMTRNLNEVSKR